MSLNKPEESGEKSLARQINNFWINASLANFAALDTIIIFTAAFVKILITENLNGINEILIPRYFEFSKSYGIIYHYDGNTEDFTEFFMIMGLLFAFLIIVQLLMVILGGMRGSREARRILKPINEIASAASSKINESTLALKSETDEKSDDDKISESDFEDLQNAIDKLEINDSVHVHTGNSDLKGLEDAVNSLIDRMRESYVRQAQFVSDASHELRTPIAVIKGYADMLDRWGKTDEKVLNESIEAIKKETAHITELVEQLLFLARGDNGRLKLDMEVFSLSDVLKSTAHEYSIIDFSHKYNCECGSVNVYGSESMIKQTVRILTDNAKKYTPDGGEITLRARRSVSGDPCFDVIDTGIGMKQTDIDHIFERFYRADPARNRETGGTGLGLSIAKMIVDKHGGRFEVSSCVGIGTRMTVIFPTVKANDESFVLNDEKAPYETTSPKR